MIKYYANESKVKKMKSTYTTGEIAKIINIHPNTVRMYEDQQLISAPIRKENGYRVFSQLHIDQFRLARTALEIEVLQNGLRKQIITIIKTTARREYDKAIKLTYTYITSVEREIAHADEAVAIANALYTSPVSKDDAALKRQEVSDLLDITPDTLRNWEMNGLLTVKRQKNGYRIYTHEDIQRLKMIRSLRCANYSLAAILRMLNALAQDANLSMDHALNTPSPDEDIISVCDKLIHSLNDAKKNALQIIHYLNDMKIKY